MTFTRLKMDLAKPDIAMLLRQLALILLACTLPIISHAETVYIGDILRVGVRAEPDNVSPAHGVVTTGMQLEVLDRTSGFIKIRSAAGVEGWIKDSYVTNQKPARLELSEAQATQQKLQAQLARQEDLLKQATAHTATLTRELANLKAANDRLNTRPAQTTQSTQTLPTQISRMSRTYLGYILLAVGLLGVGFIAGVRWQRKQAMRRLGGLRL